MLPYETAPERPLVEETVGRLQAVSAAQLRYFDTRQLRRADGAPFLIRVELALDDSLSVGRRGDAFACTIGLERLRDLAVLVDHVSAAIILATPGQRLVCSPALTGNQVEDLAAPPDPQHLAGWQSVADETDAAVPRPEIRSYLLDAALDFLLGHEFGHARLGHVDGLGAMLQGAELTEDDQVARFGFSELIQGIEYAADVAGFVGSMDDLTHSDLYRDMSEQVWAAGTLRFSLRIVACALVLLLFNMRSRLSSAHLAPLVRLLAVSQIPISSPHLVSRPVAEGAEAGVLNAFKIILQAARRVRPLQSLRHLAPGEVLDRMAEKRRSASLAMKAAVPLLAGRAYHVSGLGTVSESMEIQIQFQGLDAASAGRLAAGAGVPEGVALKDLQLSAEMGAERSNFIVSGIMSLALGVPSGVAANWVWQQIAPSDPTGQIVVVVEGKRCTITSEAALAEALEAAVGLDADSVNRPMPR